MKQNKPGQKVRFPSTVNDDELNQVFEVIEIFQDMDKPRCIIKTLGTELKYRFTKTALMDDMEICDN